MFFKRKIIFLSARKRAAERKLKHLQERDADGDENDDDDNEEAENFGEISSPELNMAAAESGKRNNSTTAIDRNTLLKSI